MPSLIWVLCTTKAGAPQDYKTAVKWWRLAAKQGKSSAQYNLGVMYSEGRGVPKDYKTAVKWHRLAAKQGIALSQNALGTMFYKGEGVIQDNVYAHMWWNIAASSGHNNAVKKRDIIAKRMTPADISTAQKLARECVAKNYKGC
jgi:TPR repeat protein